jgi:hypothetical protein
VMTHHPFNWNFRWWPTTRSIEIFGHNSWISPNVLFGNKLIKFYGLLLANFSCGCWLGRKGQWGVADTRRFATLPKAFTWLPSYRTSVQKRTWGGAGESIGGRGPLGTKKWPGPSSLVNHSIPDKYIYVLYVIRNTYYYEHYKIIQGEILLVKLRDML